MISFNFFFITFFLLTFQGEVYKGKWNDKDVAIKKLFLQLNEVYKFVFLT